MIRVYVYGDTEMLCTVSSGNVTWVFTTYFSTFNKIIFF